MIAIGVLHILLTIPNYGSISVDAVWFASTGVAIIFTGFLNIIFLRNHSKDSVVRILCITANLTILVIFILLLLNFSGLHLFVGAGIFIFASLLSIVKFRI